MLKDNEKTKHTFTKNMLVKDIADGKNEQDERIEIDTVRLVYKRLEDAVFSALSSADEDTDVSVRLFEGITLNSEFVPEKTKINNLTGETITTTSKVKPAAHITRRYCEKLTNN